MVAPRSVRDVMTKKARSEEYAVRKPRCDNSPVQVFFLHMCAPQLSHFPNLHAYTVAVVARDRLMDFFLDPSTGASAKLLSSPCAYLFPYDKTSQKGRYISTRSLFFTILLHEYVQFSCQCEVYVPVDGIFYNSVVWHLSCCNMHMWPRSMIDTARLF